MEEQSDPMDVEPLSVSTAVEWDTWRKIAVLVDSNSDLADQCAGDEPGTASVP